MLPQEKRIHTKEKLNEYLSAELSLYRCSFLKRILGVSEVAILRKHQVLLRKAEYYNNTQKTLLSLWYRFRLSKIQNRYSLHVPMNCCELGLHIMHLGPILINSNAQVGKWNSLHINTAIIANGKNNEAPVLGNYVVLGVGAVVVGPVHIADYTAIGANAVCSKSVYEENTVVAGVPAKKISNNGSKSWNKQ